jgi:peptidyl-prolyl cis-trans isomerase A (cyclophilin A)
MTKLLMSTVYLPHNINDGVKSIAKKLSATLIFAIVLSASHVQATTVEFQTSQGNFEISLYDETTPKTVANFLNYVNAGSYTNTVFHRSMPDFVIQGGGFIFEGSTTLTKTATNSPVVNEPVWSNVKGTIAMAKTSQPNSATNQWFFNTENNSSNLDVDNNGYTVFGQVTTGTDISGQVTDGINIINTIADQTTCRFTDLFSNVPMVNYDCTGTPSAENYITVYAITIIDSNESTIDGLTQVKNTLINNSDNGGSGDTNKSSSGGGAFYWLTILAVTVLSSRYKRNKL